MNLQWEYHGEYSEMVLRSKNGDEVLPLSVDIPTAHALARFVDKRLAEARLEGQRELSQEILRLPSVRNVLSGLPVHGA